MLYAIIAVLIIIADQLLKYWVTLNIPLNGGSVGFIPGVISLVNIHNKGAAFGMLQNGRILFIVIAVVFIAIVVYALASNIIKAPIGRWSAVGVLAGAIGNCIDRIMNGYVVDMFKFEFINHAIFNIADVFISVCGVIFCIYIIMGKDEEQKPEPAPALETRHRPNVQELRALGRRPQMRKKTETVEPLSEEARSHSPRKREEGEEIPPLRRKYEAEEKREAEPERKVLPEERKTHPEARRVPRIDSRNARPAQRKPGSDDVRRPAAAEGREPRVREGESRNPFAKWDMATKREQRPVSAPREESARPRYPEMQRPIEPTAPIRRPAPEKPIAAAEAKPAALRTEPVKTVEAAPAVPVPEKKTAPPRHESFDLEDILAEFK